MNRYLALTMAVVATAVVVLGLFVCAPAVVPPVPVPERPRPHLAGSALPTWLAPFAAKLDAGYDFAPETSGHVRLSWVVCDDETRPRVLVASRWELDGIPDLTASTDFYPRSWGVVTSSTEQHAYMWVVYAFGWTLLGEFSEFENPGNQDGPFGRQPVDVLAEFRQALRPGVNEGALAYWFDKNPTTPGIAVLWGIDIDTLVAQSPWCTVHVRNMERCERFAAHSRAIVSAIGRKPWIGDGESMRAYPPNCDFAASELRQFAERGYLPYR